MEKKTTPLTNKKSPDAGSGANYAYKPLLIGAVIKSKAEEKKLKPKDVAAYLGIKTRQVYRIYKMKYVDMPMLFKCSEMLQENLLLEYHPNVKPLPNPLQEVVDRLSSYNKDDESYKGKCEALQKKVIVLEGKNEMLQDLVMTLKKG